MSRSFTSHALKKYLHTQTHKLFTIAPYEALEVSSHRATLLIAPSSIVLVASPLCITTAIGITVAWITVISVISVISVFDAVVPQTISF